MNYSLEIEKPDEIRCPYCLSWNSKQANICTECTTGLYESYSFGATRALFSWEHTEPSHLAQVYASEKKDKIAHWNNLFRIQLDFFREEFLQYDFLFKNFILEIQEEVYKYFLSGLPMRPEQFKEFKEYELPPHTHNELERLNQTFRTHPSSVFKSLAAMALIQKGKADPNLVHYLGNWNAHYKKIRQEKLLTLAHWSVQKLTTFTNYKAYINEVMPLLHREEVVASWAKVFLYKADYNVQELKFELENIAASGHTQLAISACFALRQYDKIKELLLHNLDESTIELAYVHSDERHIPKLLMFLKHAPRKYHEQIIRRCVQLKPQDDKTREQIVSWLLSQDDQVLPEVLFDWEKIPRTEEVIAKLLASNSGIQSLLNFLPSWMQNNQIRIKNCPGLELLISKDDDSLDLKGQELLQRLRKKIQELDFTILCESLRKKSEAEDLHELFEFLFAPKANPTDRQITDGFHCLIRVAENTKTTEVPYFLFLPNWGIETVLSEEDFHARLLHYLENKDSQRIVANWLASVYEMQATSKAAPAPDKVLFEKHTAVALSAIESKLIDPHTGLRLLKLLFRLKNVFTLSENLQKQLQALAASSHDFEIKYWTEQIQEPNA
jgi:hypothetical protein